MVMTLSRNYPLGLQVAVAVILIIFSLTVVPSNSVGSSPSFAESDMQQRNNLGFKAARMREQVHELQALRGDSGHSSPSKEGIRSVVSWG
ncbi:hypothetical protein RJ639_007086 [Escallonia herrerae]|uniref:Uncharacterized protein n=1 Tax=Escallonia herrerae TaxID=1293975 RepID=A0AA89AZ22_9ASTE|nr:hypothetical protein RJ639_007086 [Escallonia herrerae]